MKAYFSRLWMVVAGGYIERVIAAVLNRDEPHVHRMKQWTREVSRLPYGATNNSYGAFPDEKRA
jgi:hypothetical protein